MGEYYVDCNHPNASDLNIGSIDSPWKSMLRATFAPELSGDDTVYFRGGTYTGRLHNGVSTMSGKSPITFKNYPGEKVYFSTTKNTRTSNFNWKILNWTFEPQFYSITSCTAVEGGNVLRIDLTFNPFYVGEFCYIPSISSYAGFYSSTELEKNHCIYKVLSATDNSIIINIGFDAPGGFPSFASTISTDGKIAQPAVKLQLERNVELENDYKAYRHHLDYILGAYDASKLTSSDASSAYRPFIHWNGIIPYYNQAVRTFGSGQVYSYPPPSTVSYDLLYSVSPFVGEISLSGYNDLFYDDYVLIGTTNSYNNTVGIDRSGNSLFAPISTFFIDFKNNERKINGNNYSCWKVLSANKQFAWIEAFFTPGLTGTNVTSNSGFRLFNSWHIHNPYRNLNKPILSGGPYNNLQQLPPIRSLNPDLKDKGYFGIKYRRCLHFHLPYSYDIFNFRFNSPGYISTLSNTVTSDYPLVLPGITDVLMNILGGWNPGAHQGWQPNTTYTSRGKYMQRRLNRLDFFNYQDRNYYNNQTIRLNDPYSSLVFYLMLSGTSGAKNPFVPYAAGNQDRGEGNQKFISTIYSNEDIFVKDGTCVWGSNINNDAMFNVNCGFNLFGENIMLQGELGTSPPDQPSSFYLIHAEYNTFLQKGALNSLRDCSLNNNCGFFQASNNTLYLNYSRGNFNPLEFSSDLDAIMPSPHYKTEFLKTNTMMCSGTGDNKLEVINYLIEHQAGCKAFNTTHLFRPGDKFSFISSFYQSYTCIDDQNNYVNVEKGTLMRVISSYYDSTRCNTIVDFVIDKTGEKLDITRYKFLRIIKNHNNKFEGITFLDPLQNATGNNFKDCVFENGGVYNGYISTSQYDNCFFVNIYDGHSNQQGLNGNVKFNNCFFDKNNRVMASGANNKNKSVTSTGVTYKNNLFRDQRFSYAKWYDIYNNQMKFVDNQLYNCGGGFFLEISNNQYPKWKEWRPDMMVAFDGILEGEYFYKTGSDYFFNSLSGTFNCPFYGSIGGNYDLPWSNFFRYQFPRPGSGFTNIKVPANYLLRPVSAINYGLFKATGFTSLTAITARSGIQNPFLAFNNFAPTFVNSRAGTSLKQNEIPEKLLFDGNILWSIEVLNQPDGNGFAYSNIDKYSLSINQEYEDYWNQNPGEENVVVGNKSELTNVIGEFSSTNNVLYAHNTNMNKRGLDIRTYDRGGKPGIKSTSSAFDVLGIQGPCAHWYYTSNGHLIYNNILSQQTTTTVFLDNNKLQDLYTRLGRYGQNYIQYRSTYPSYPALIEAMYISAKYSHFAYVGYTTQGNNDWYFYNSYSYSDDSKGQVRNAFNALSSLNCNLTNYIGARTHVMSADFNFYDTSSDISNYFYVNFNQSIILSAASYLPQIGTDIGTPFWTTTANWSSYKVFPNKVSSLSGTAAQPDFNSSHIPIEKYFKRGNFYYDLRKKAHYKKYPYPVETEIVGNHLAELNNTSAFLSGNSNNVIMSLYVHEGGTIEINKLTDTNNILSIISLPDKIIWTNSSKNSTALKYLEHNNTYLIAASGNININNQLPTYYPLPLDNYIGWGEV